MATVTGITATRAAAIEAASVVGGTVVNNELILTRQNGSTINAGNVRGTQGPAGTNGTNGAQGPAGPTGPQGAQGPAGAAGLDTTAGDARYLKLDSQPVTFAVSASDETTAISASTSVPKVRFRAPFAFTLTEVRATLSVAETAQVTTVDVHGTVGGTPDVTVLGTKVTIDANEKTSVTAATPGTIADAAVADDEELSFYCDGIGTVGRGLKFWLLGFRSVVNQVGLPTAPVIVTTSLNAMQVGFPFSQTISATGSATITFAVTTGTLPAGLSLASSTGIISGTPSASGAYSFTITATNAQGSDPQAYTGTVAAATVPGTPTSLSPTAGNAQVTLTWTAPASNGGNAITSYTIKHSATGAFAGEETTVTGQSSGAVITGLTNGSIRYFRVAAVNGIGTGTYTSSVSSTPTSGATLPAAPATPTLNSGASGAYWRNITFAAPTPNGSPAVTGYKVRYSLAGLNTWTVEDSAGTISVDVNLAATLEANTSYDIQVAAVNTNGIGPYSTSLTTSTSSGRPGIPTSVSGTASSGQVALTWTAPANNGGSALVDYVVEQSANGTSGWATASGGSITTTTGQTVTGLTDGVAVYFRVAARNGLSAPNRDSAWVVVGPFTPSSGGSAPVYVGYSEAIDSTAPVNDTLTITRTAIGTINAGDTLIACVTSVFDSKVGSGYGTPSGGGWTNITSDGGSSFDIGLGGGLQVYIKTATGSEPSTYSVSGGGSGNDYIARFSIIAYRGATTYQTAGQFEQTANATLTVPSITPSVTNGRLITIFHAMNAITAINSTAPSGHTERRFTTGGGIIGDSFYISEQTAACSTSATGVTSKSINVTGAFTNRGTRAIVLMP